MKRSVTSSFCQRLGYVATTDVTRRGSLQDVAWVVVVLVMRCVGGKGEGWCLRDEMCIIPMGDVGLTVRRRKRGGGTNMAIHSQLATDNSGLARVWHVPNSFPEFF